MSRLAPAVLRTAVCSLAALALGACSESPSSPTAAPLTPTEPAASKAQEFNGKHVFHVKDFYAKTNAARPNGTGISYHGGTVIAGPAVTKVVSIYWGNSTIYAGQASGTGNGAADPTLIGAFLRNLGGSPYFNINTTYYNGAGSKVLNQVSYTGYWTTAGSACAAPSSAPTDANMVALIQCGLSNGYLAYDPNTVYAIFTGSGINLGGGFGSQYCAYHTHGATSQGNVYYAAMPYNQQYPANCTSQYASPNADVAGNSEVNTLAHEIEETTTDAMGNAWFDNRGYENADKCAWTWGTVQTAANGGRFNMTLADGKQYLVQQNWVNAGSGGCALRF